MSSSPILDRRVAIGAVVLSAITFLLYLPAFHFSFISLDDTAYVVNNFHVNTGVHWRDIPWYFQAGHAGNWHPLTWLSHAIDCQFFDLHPGAHHGVNVGIHVINSLLLFVILHQMTMALWRSWVTAALFAWHPMHVESVAWVAERKDVLSTLFWFLTIWAYIAYSVRVRGGATR